MTRPTRNLAHARTGARVALALLVLALLVPSVALAAPWRGIGVTLYDIDQMKTPTLVVYGSLTPDTPLPVEVELPIPAGSTIGWVGEILGGDPALDPTLEYTVRSEDGYDVIVATIATGRAIQAELAPPEGWVEFTDAGAEISMKWTAHEDVPGVRIGFEVATTQHAENLSPSGVTAGLTQSGVLYSIETSPVAAGSVLTLAGTATDGADPTLANPVSGVAGENTTATPEQEAPEQVEPRNTIDEPASRPAISQRALLIGLLSALVVVLIIALLYILRGQKRA